MLNWIRFAVEIAGWFVVVLFCLAVLWIAFNESLSLAIRWRLDSLRLWRLLFYAKLKCDDWVPSEVTTTDGAVWIHIHDRWYWRRRLPNDQ